MAVHDNAKVLKDGFDKGLRLIEQTVRNSLHYAATELVHLALQNRGYTGFTGNTQTSYACGIYINGVLVEVVDSQSFQDKPVRYKIKRGRIVYLQNPYEGRPRMRTGYADVDEEYGIDTSLEFLNEYKAPKQGIALVMTTGTEYSDFLETVMRLDVLTRTYREAPKVIESNWRKIPD